MAVSIKRSNQLRVADKLDAASNCEPDFLKFGRRQSEFVVRHRQLCLGQGKHPPAIKDRVMIEAITYIPQHFKVSEFIRSERRCNDDCNKATCACNQPVIENDYVFHWGRDGVHHIVSGERHWDLKNVPPVHDSKFRAR